MSLFGRKPVETDVRRLRRLHHSIRDVKTARGVSVKMAQPVLKAAMLLAPVNPQPETKRYRQTGSRSGVKKRGRKKRTRIWMRTRSGNLRDSHTIYANIAEKARFVRVGPRVYKKHGKPFAFYAWAVHKLHNPWLKKAWIASRQKAIAIGLKETKQLIDGS